MHRIDLVRDGIRPAGQPTAREQPWYSARAGPCGVVQAEHPGLTSVKRAHYALQRQSSSVVRAREKSLKLMQHHEVRLKQLAQYEDLLEAREQPGASSRVAAMRASEAQSYSQSRVELQREVRQAEALRDDAAAAHQRRRHRLHEELDLDAGSSTTAAGVVAKSRESGRAAAPRPATAPPARTRAWERGVDARCAHIGRARPRGAAAPARGTFERQLGRATNAVLQERLNTATVRRFCGHLPIELAAWDASTHERF